MGTSHTYPKVDAPKAVSTAIRMAREAKARIPAYSRARWPRGISFTSSFDPPADPRFDEGSFTLMASPFANVVWL